MVSPPESALPRALRDVHVRAGTPTNCGGIALVVLDVEPPAAGAAQAPGWEFVSDLAPGELPEEYVAELREGVREAVEESSVAVRVRLRRALDHPDSRESRFRQAGRLVVLEALKHAGGVPAWAAREVPPRRERPSFGGGYNGCCVSAAGDHWGFTTYWLAELWRRRDPPVARRPSRGYELTLRVPRHPDDARPPGWGFTLLNTLEFTGWNQHHTVGDGRWLDLGRPLARGRATELTGLAFVDDPLSPGTDGPHGRADFLLAVGVTAAEMAWMERDGVGAVLGELSAGDPLLITDLGRPSVI
ncbi:suppressor of fused domain protein [Actinomadura scrupuli]|uniref:suppressor of fused domain protein n=1 Tax=Actinomadura scrupuli TaxID=559629 RepID=UPI003D98B59A